MNLPEGTPVLPKRPATRPKIGSVHPNSSPQRKKVGFAATESVRRVSADATLQTTPSIDETQPVEDFSNHPERKLTLKSCMSAPNLSGMAPMKRNVSFSKIEIREYERTLGDNPCVSAGPPLSLDWKYNPDHKVFDVEHYEDSKTPRSRSEMLMPRAVREVILKEHWDVSRGEMNNVVREVNITKRNRRATARSSSTTEKRHEQVEKASRKMKRILSLGKKKDEQKLWKDVKTMCGKRVYSMNDLAAYTTVRTSLDNFEPEPARTAGEKSQYESQDSLSSSGNESATSLPAALLDDDDDWGFGLDEDHE